MQLTSCIWWRLYSICKTTQEVVSDTIIYVLQEETKDPVTFIWLICYLNCYQFSWPSCYSLLLQIQSLNQVLSQSFVIQETPGRLKLFYKEADGAHGRWAVWFRESPIGSNLVTEKLRKIKCVTKVCIIRK